MWYTYTMEYYSATKKENPETAEELQSCSLWNKNHIHRKIDKMKTQRTMYWMKEQD